MRKQIHQVLAFEFSEYSRFWRLLGKAVPDHEDRRRELRRVGARFEW